MDLCLVRRGNEQWYCPKEQADMWAEQGCAVYELTPMKIAGQEQGVAAEDGARLTGEGSTLGDTGATMAQTYETTTGGPDEP